MPVFPNIGTKLAEMDPNARKRKAEEMDAGEVAVGEDGDFETCGKQQAALDAFSPQKSSVTATPTRPRAPSSSSLSSLDSVADLESPINPLSPKSTSTGISPSRQNASVASSPRKQTSVAPTSTSTQPAKRKKLTTAEKKAKEEEKEKKKAEKEQKRQENEERKARAEAEKEKRRKEAAEKKAKADAEKQARAEEKEAKRLQKEEEERKIQEQKDKKARSQPKLNSFFTKPSTTMAATSRATPNDTDKPSTPATESSSTAESPVKTKKLDDTAGSYYHKKFKPFFVKKDVSLATSPFAMDEDAKDAKSRILDEYISGQRGQLETNGFDPVDLLKLPRKPKSRGEIHEPVGITVRWFQSELEKAVKRGDLQKQEALQRQIRQKLARVPVKVLCFQQDVRPPYRGTVTAKQHEVGPLIMRKLARKPTQPVIESLLYGYDSEAEWQEEEGEDIDLDDEDDEDLEEDDDVANLIDDSEAVDLTRFAQGLEPQNTGLCWEDSQGANHCASTSMTPYAMEFIVGDRLQKNLGIDPFSTEYWEPEKKATTAKSASNKQAANAFQQIENGGSATTAAPSGESKSKGKTAAGNGRLPPGLARDDLTRIKKEIKKNFETTPRISKLGMIEYLKSSALDGIKVNGKDISRGDVKVVLDVVAERKMKGGEVLWSLKPGHHLDA